MKVLVVTSMIPFVRDDVDVLADDLVANLQQTAGISAELLRIPFSAEPFERVVEEMLLCRMMELYWVDRVIGLAFPTYLIPHTHKTLWLARQYRPAYAALADRQETGTPRDLVRKADNDCFAAAHGIFVSGSRVQDRLRRNNGVSAAVLPPPLKDARLFANRSTGDYIFAGGRINSGRRQSLLIEALKLCRSGVRLIIAGVPDCQADAEALRAAAADPALEGRIVLDLGPSGGEKRAGYVNNALACACLHEDDDFDGFAAMEAFQAAKPVIACPDAGGVLDLVLDRQTGLVVEPRPDALADAMDFLFHDRSQAETLGRAAHALGRERRAGWAGTIERLLS
jgi:glycosyltransferase involved in cell wall biosynthesis